MIIKDIRSFREFYKSNIVEVNLNNRNPHFAGDVRNESQREFGFFHMFNGHGDIENKLTTILNIAGDSQAIYEFMQNAVDADSRNFFLAKYGTEDRPYLIVLNDGEYFSLQSVISILAIGASSKYRNPDNIGQFGVGFKLAHRLIGADNSLKELLDENKGPILFSWANGELEKLADIHSFKITNPNCDGFGKDAVSNSNAPWLFKIIATNFPCLMEDEVWDAKGRPTQSLFTDEDFSALRGAAQQCLQQCKEAVNFRTGTLLVIPLYPAKVNHVIGKIPKGLEVAATIISRRAKKAHDLCTQIETEELVPECLSSELWELGEEETKGRLGNEQVKIAELMFLYGDPFGANPFKGKPQFYRYFPMSLEQHGFRFAIHSNALTLSSARTELQENDSNKFLFSRLIPLLEIRIKEYAETNPERFCQLYASLLLSNRGEGSNEWIQGRQWLEHTLWQPLLELLKKNIPVKSAKGFILVEVPEKVLIKNSQLPIENWYKKEHEGWFFWELMEQPLACTEAIQKLKIISVSLLDVLTDAQSIVSINEWLSKSPDHAAALLKELNESNLEGRDKSVVWKNFNLLKLWWFYDGVYSIETLAKEEGLKYHLINYGPLNAIKDRLTKVDVFVSGNFLDDYEKIERTIRESAQRSLQYLYNYEELNKLLSFQFSSKAELDAADKIAVFNALESAVRSSANTSVRRIETMKPLALFSNKRGEVKPLYQLTSLSNIPQMLQGWRIMEGESLGVNLKEYLSDTREAVYEHIIRPFWHDIATQPGQSPDQRRELFTFVKACYTLKPSMGPLYSDTVFFTEAGGRSKSFFHQSLAQINEADYRVLSGLLPKYGIDLPQRSLLSFYSEAPFLLPSASSIDIGSFPETISVEEAKALIRWLLNAFPDVLKGQIFQNTENGRISIKQRPHGVNNYYSDRLAIHEYIERYLSQSLYRLPDVLHGFMGDHLLQGEKLLERLIHEAPNFPESLLSLVKIVQEHGNDFLKQKLLSGMQLINLAEIIERDSLNHNLLKLCFSMPNEQVRKEALGKLAGIIKDGTRIPLHKIQNRGSDTVTVEKAKKGRLDFSVNLLLSGAANAVNQMLTHVSEQWVQLGIGTNEQIAFALGIHERRKPQEIADQVLQHIRTEGRVENSAQLAFIWATGLEKELAKLDPKIETRAGWLPLKSSFYLRPAPFIPAGKVLSPQYENLLKECSIENDLMDGVIWTIQVEAFLNGGVWTMPGIEGISEQDRPNFWKYLFEKWEEAGSTEKIILRDHSQSWKTLLGLIPAELILSEDYSLPEEKVPVQELAAYDLPLHRISAFMAALGAQAENAAVVRTRKFFRKEGGSIDTGMTLPQTVATLKWLSINEIVLQRDDIASFYRNLAGKYEGLYYFPASIPGIEGYKIVSLSGEAYYLSKEELQTAAQYSLKLKDIAAAANAPIIYAGILQDWMAYLAGNARPLIIKWNETDWEQALDEGKEWEFPFYKEWKVRYPYFQIRCLAGGEVPRMILINGNKVKSFRKGRVATYQDKSIVFVGGTDTEHLLNALEVAEAFNSNARNYLRICYEAQAVQFEQFVQLAKNDSGFAKLLKEHAEAIKLKEERAERAKVVKDADNKYTLSWFLNLLELVRVQEQSANVPEVTFSKCKRVPTAQSTYELSESSGRIPSNIEAFDEIPAVITYLNDKGESTTANTKLVASQKYQKLWVMFPEAAVQPILEHTNKILSIRIVFTRTVNLIEELKNGFRRLGLPENINLKETLSPEIDFIFGPPGTGKTTELARRLIRRSTEGTIGPVIVLTPTNKAADVLAKKIIELNNYSAPFWLVRAGSCTDPMLLQEKVVKTGADLLIEAGSDKVIITTVHRFPYFTVPIHPRTTEKARLCDCPWAEVIFDEASMIPIAYITHAIQARQRANAATRFLVSGDPLQIPPVFDLLTEDLEDVAEELQQENIYSMIGLRSFDNAVQQSIPVYGNRIHNLDVQHRSIPAIGELFSKFQYGGRIRHSRGTVNNNKSSTSRPLPKRFSDLGFKPITIIRYPVKPGDSIFKPQKLDGSPIHLYSSLLVNELIKLFRQEVKEKNEKPWSMGVLAPYRSQADLMLKMLEGHPQRNSEVIITTDTVHGFQGDENNIVFAIFNPSGTGDNISCSRFLKKEFILNVAISRAEDYLVLLIPDENSKGISGLPLMNQLIELAKQTKPELLSVLHSAELEERLTGEKRFFETRSFSTAHQKVNVYGTPDLPYIIRLNENSLDVHWEI